LHEEEQQMIKSIRNCLNVLNCFSSENLEIQVTEISKKLHLSKSTISRVLSTLGQDRFVVKIPTTQKYRLGPKILELANIFYSNTELGTIAKPYLKDLRNKTGETTSIFVIDGDERVCLEKVDSSQEVRAVLRIGSHHPLYAGSPGKLLLAYQPKEVRKEIFKKRLPRITPYTITKPKLLEEEMSKIRQQGYSISHKERVLFVASISTPIRDFTGAVVAALCVSGPEVRFTNEKQENFIKLAKIAADKISKELGCVEKRKNGEPSP
jgi:IclR family KDG regulon transcriptional repressor